MISPSISPKELSLWERLRRLDFHPKTKEDFRVRTAYGGASTSRVVFLGLPKEGHKRGGPGVEIAIDTLTRIRAHTRPCHTHPASIVALFFMTYLFFTELSYSMEKVGGLHVVVVVCGERRNATPLVEASVVVRHTHMHLHQPRPKTTPMMQEIVDHMYVNSSRDGRVLFNFNITFPSVSCSLLSADAMDPLGNKQVGWVVRPSLPACLPAWPAPFVCRQSTP